MLRWSIQSTLPLGVRSRCLTSSTENLPTKKAWLWRGMTANMISTTFIVEIKNSKSVISYSLIAQIDHQWGFIREISKIKSEEIMTKESYHLISLYTACEMIVLNKMNCSHELQSYIAHKEKQFIIHLIFCEL